MIRNFTDNLMAYALGRRVEYYDQPTVRAIAKKAAQNGNKFSSFVLGHRQQRGVPDERRPKRR